MGWRWFPVCLGGFLSRFLFCFDFSIRRLAMCVGLVPILQHRTERWRMYGSAVDPDLSDTPQPLCFQVHVGVCTPQSGKKKEIGTYSGK